MDELWAVLALFALGIGLRRFGVFPGRGKIAAGGKRVAAEDAFQVLATFVIYVSLPGAILSRVPKLVLSTDVLAPILIPWAMLAFSAAAILLLARCFAWDRSTRGAMLLVVPLGNTSFLGLPMVRAFLGESAVPYALLYDQFGTFLGIATYGTVVVAMHADAADEDEKKERTLLGVALRIVKFPPFVSLAAALLLHGVVLPRWIAGTLDVAAQSLVPVIMVAVGLRLDLRSVRDDAQPLAIGLVLKMAIAPLLAWAICRATHATGEAATTSVFEAGMPPMITAGAVAAQAGLRPGLAVSAVGVGLLLSFATLPILHALQ